MKAGLLAAARRAVKLAAAGNKKGPPERTLLNRILQRSGLLAAIGETKTGKAGAHEPERARNRDLRLPKLRIVA